MKIMLNIGRAELLKNNLQEISKRSSPMPLGMKWKLEFLMRISNNNKNMFTICKAYKKLENSLFDKLFLLSPIRTHKNLSMLTFEKENVDFYSSFGLVKQ